MIILILGNSKVGKDTLANAIVNWYPRTVVTHAISDLKDKWCAEWGFDPDSREDRAELADPMAEGYTPGMTWGEWMMKQCELRANRPELRMKDVLLPLYEDVKYLAMHNSHVIVTGVRHMDEVDILMPLVSANKGMLVFHLYRRGVPATKVDTNYDAMLERLSEYSSVMDVEVTRMRNGTAEQWFDVAKKIISGGK